MDKSVTGSQLCITETKMAQRYISAMEFTNWHADAVLKKHSKKRPLGDIESKHRYVQIQPVLSCRTVDIDIDGTRSFRPRSSSAILDEQQEIIHKMYPKQRNILSAPLRKDNLSTSKSRTTMSQKSSSKRFRHPSTSDQSLLDCPSDISKTSRSCRELTDLIHHQWCPENHSLNEGRYVRGANNNQDPSAVNTWVTFGGGSSSGDSDRIVNVFTNAKNNGDFYSIPGDVGNRLTHQISSGGNIRIGKNGGVKTTESEITRYVTESKAHMVAVENIPVFLEEKSPIVPLSWDNQLHQADVKVVSPRRHQEKIKPPNLCETHPVVFEKLTTGRNIQITPFQSLDGGYQVKQTAKNQFKFNAKDRKRSSLSRRKTARDDEDIMGVSLDNFLNETFGCKTKQGDRNAWAERGGESPTRYTVSRDSTMPSPRVQEYLHNDCSPESQRTSASNSNAQRIRPSHPAEVNRSSGALSLMLTPTSNKSLYRNKNNSPTPKPKTAPKKVSSAKRSSSATSIKSVHSPAGDTEYIQITHQMKGSRKNNSHLADSVGVKPDSTKRVTFNSKDSKDNTDVTEPKICEKIEVRDDSSENENIKTDINLPATPVPTARSESPTPAISIPTADTSEYVINAL